MVAVILGMLVMIVLIFLKLVVIGLTIRVRELEEKVDNIEKWIEGELKCEQDDQYELEKYRD